MTINQHYQRISEELSTNAMDGVLWTKALAESEGDLNKTKALYIRLRMAALNAPPQSPEADKAGSADEAVELRRKIQAKLALNKRASLYGTLGLAPTCSSQDCDRDAGAQSPAKIFAARNRLYHRTGVMPHSATPSGR